ACYRATTDWKGLVALLNSVADKTDNPTRKVALLREAATVQSDQLGDHDAAIALLRKASEVTPDDVALRIDLAAALGLNGHAEDAIATLSETLETTEDRQLRLALLSARAKVRRSIDQLREAIDDLEQALEIDPNVGADLEQALEALRMAASADGDLDGERGPTLRLVALRQARGADDDARELLVGWVDRQRKDLEALHQLRAIELGTKNWEGVVKVAGRLVALESGEAKVDAA